MVLEAFSSQVLLSLLLWRSYQMLLVLPINLDVIAVIAISVLCWILHQSLLDSVPEYLEGGTHELRAVGAASALPAVVADLDRARLPRAEDVALVAVLVYDPLLPPNKQGSTFVSSALIVEGLGKGFVLLSIER